MKIENLVWDPMTISDEHMANVRKLLDLMNKFEAVYGKELTVTSGYRRPQDHERIYSKINKERKAKRLKPLPIPLGSQHLKGNACDILDPEKALQTWILEHLEVVEDIGLWFEHFDFTRNWAHFQSVPPKSGKRFFIP